MIGPRHTLQTPASTRFQTNSLVAFFATFLSYVHIGSDFGAIIACDIVALVIIALNFRSFWNICLHLGLLFIFSGLIISGILSQIINNSNEFVFVARLFLTAIDGIAFALLVKADRSNFSSILSAVTLGYLTGLILFLFLPSFQSLVDLKSLKAWIAVFPMLAVYACHAHGWRKARSIVLGIVVIIALVFQSRTLLTTSLLFIMYTYLQAKLAWKIAGSVVLIALALVLLSQMDTLVQAQEHSNSFRSAMILQITNFSYPELLLGRGIDNWRIAGLRDLINLPGAAEFFEAANPHFFPAEVIIRGGITWLLLITLLCTRIARGSTTWVFGGILIVGSFFTTNTGSERLVISIGLFIAIVGNRQFPVWLGMQFLRSPQRPASGGLAPTPLSHAGAPKQ